MDWRHLPEILAAGEAVFTELKNLIVWVKDNGGMGSASIVHVMNSSSPSSMGRQRIPTPLSSVSMAVIERTSGSTAVSNTRRPGRMEELALHPTVKPVQMIADAIRDVSGRGDVVLDLFGGSGSTLIAAEKTGRWARLCELDPIYCDRILARWESYTGDDAERCVGTQLAGDQKHPDGSAISGRRNYPSGSGEIGYRKPPEAHRFKKGQSGNPRGRPKGAKSDIAVPSERTLRDMVLKEARRLITVGEGDRSVTLTIAEAIIRTLAVNAAKGKGPAQRLFTKMLSMAEQENEKIRELTAKASKNARRRMEVMFVSPRSKDWNNAAKAKPDDDGAVGAGTIPETPDKS